MSAHVLAFQPRPKRPQPWTNEELAELYRVVDILGRAGLSVVTDMGLSDEGDPWFVFCRAESGDVIAHFARIDGLFVAASVVVDATYRGANFRQIVDSIVKSQPLVLPTGGDRGTRLLMHPSVVLTAFVATALAHSEKAHADILHAVEAKWDAGAADHATRHGKGGWLETFRGFVAEMRAAAESEAPSAGQSVTLASLIAIAMAAMQPVVDKLSSVASVVLDGVHAAEAALHPLADHVLAALSDLPVFQAADAPPQDTIVVKAEAGLDGAVHKAVGDAAGEWHVVADMTIVVAAAAPKAILVADDSAHVTQTAPVTADPPAPTLALSQDAAAISLLSAIKSGALLADAAAHTQVVTTTTDDTFLDINPQALQILNITIDPAAPDHTTKSTDGDGTHSLASSTSVTNGSVDGGATVSTGTVSGTTVSGGTDSTSHLTASSGSTSGSSAQAAESATNEANSANATNGSNEANNAGTSNTTATNSASAGSAGAGDSGTNSVGNATVLADGSGSASSAGSAPSSPVTVTLNTADAGVDVVNDLVNFAASSSHLITESYAPTSALLQSLTPYETPGQPLKLVVFEGALSVPVFQFSPNVVFVEESLLTTSAHLDNPGGNIVLELANGSSVTLVGVAVIPAHALA